MEALKRDIKANKFQSLGGTPEILCKWNYITCGAPIVGNMGVSADGVAADGNTFSMIMPGPNGETYTLSGCHVGAFTAAGVSPSIEGTVPATDTASTAAGLNLQLDGNTADNLGCQLSCGSPHGSNSNKYIAGTHSGHIDATFFTADWTDYDCVAVGFRKAEANQTGHGAILATGAAGDGVYTDFAALGNMGGDNLETATDKNNVGTSVSTDSSQDNADSQNMRVRVALAKSGAVAYSVVLNGVAGAGTLAAPTTTAAFSFDIGDTLIPYVVIQKNGSDDVQILLKDLEIYRTPGIVVS